MARTCSWDGRQQDSQAIPIWRALEATTQAWHQEQMKGLGEGRCQGCWAGTNLVYMKWHRTVRSAQRLTESDMTTWML